MDKITLRDTLFQKYFQIEDGILISDFMDKLSFIPETWNELHLLCESNIKYFDSFTSIEKCEMLELHQKKYLILKLKMWKYIIIDVAKMENINDIEFDEIKEENGSIYSSLYQLEKYEGDVQKLVNFYIENQNTLCLSSKFYYRLEEGNAWTWFRIDFVNANAQMGFQTPDQFLYEQLFLKYDLTPCKMQDTQQKMGIEKCEKFLEK